MLTEKQLARFWAKVDKTSECWTWTASKDRYGYGRVGVKGKNWLAHRVSFLLHKNYLPEGMVIDHMCHNRACVNPDHLRPLTSKQNSENRAGLDMNNRSGVRGVHWSNQKKKWKATVYHNNAQFHVGFFTSIESAKSAVIEMRNELFTHNDMDRRGEVSPSLQG